MDSAKQHWPILQKLGNDLVNKVCSFLVIGKNGEAVIVATEDGQGFWLGKLRFECGKSKTSIEPTPLNLPELVHMSQSNSHILLLNKRGEIWSMGQNDRGQLGLGTIDDDEVYFYPQLISVIPPTKFISVRCGKSGHSLALTEDGKVWAWGWNDCCQAGEPNFTGSIRFPHQIPELDPHRIVAIECGGYHSLALTDQGVVYGWGMNEFGQLGDGSETFTICQHPPIRIPTPMPVRSMAAGRNHTLLLSQTGEVWSCGSNRQGQLGFSTFTKSTLELSMVSGLRSISQIASHPATHLSVAMSSNQRCYVWGQLDNENLGKSFIKINTPLKLPHFYSTVESPLSFYSTHRSTPNSVQVTIPDTPPYQLSATMSRMFDNPETSPDVQFVVEQRTIHAHRIILSNSSDYFARMFSEQWLGPVDPKDPIVRVTISDHSYQVFHAFLHLLYTDCLEVYTDLLSVLFELASQYLVPDLQQLCLSRMRTTVTPTTCCLYYPLTVRHSQFPELATFQHELVQFASTRMSEVENSAAYKSMEYDSYINLKNAVKNFQAT